MRSVVTSEWNLEAISLQLKTLIEPGQQLLKLAVIDEINRFSFAHLLASNENSKDRQMITIPNQRDLKAARRALEFWEQQWVSTLTESDEAIYGRRIEADGNWSIYRVFGGATLIADDKNEIGLSSSQSLARLCEINTTQRLSPTIISGGLKPSFADWIREH